MANTGKPPRFKVGQRVKSFRGETATVTNVYNQPHPGKSHRVGVRWDNPRGKATRMNPDPREDKSAYYEQVFSPIRGENLGARNRISKSEKRPTH